MIDIEVKVYCNCLWTHTNKKILANRKNKQKFTDLLNSKLNAAGVRTEHAKTHADLLIVKSAVKPATIEDEELVGEGTDLLVLLCYNAKDLTSK